MNLDELFVKWEENGNFNFFVKDGIICEDVYSLQKTKILFVLRDAHIAEGQKPPYDLRVGLANPIAEGKTWNNVARWTNALLSDSVEFEKIENINADELKKQLIRVAVLNLKKEAGESRAKNIEKYAKEHSEWIKKEIEICNPDIIVAGGTFDDLFSKVYRQTVPKEIIKGNFKGREYRKGYVMVQGREIPVIDQYHPQYTGKNKKLFYDMVEMRKLLIME